MKKLFLGILFAALFTSQCHAVKELKPDMLEKVNNYRMTKQEQHKTKIFVARWKRSVKNLPKNEKFIKAVNTILERAEYLKYKHNPSDVISHKADCQGYSIMLYLLLDSVNVKCKVVYNEEHMWNKVKTNTKWYKVDLVALDSLNITLGGKE